MLQLPCPLVSGFIRLAFMHLLIFKSAFCEIEYNNVNPDGSFSFRHSNDDIGSYYHGVAGNPNNNVRGRYGSRNPQSGIVEETIYTAGPRGFRVNGPQIHRKMDLSQTPNRPIGNIDDPLADPYDDSTYSFNSKTQMYNRNEEADSTGRVKGLYSYFDDIGEKHTVRYAAGAGTGFEIFNSVPDNPTTLAYTAPLYKATPETRGKISVQRGRNGLYKFIATGPDQRRSEISGPDGIVRGAYSYLDDKGVQRTVEYEAGAGIGYRVIKNSIGRSAHRNTLIPSLRSSDTGVNSYLHSLGPSIIQKKSNENNQSKNSQKEDNNKFLNENFNQNSTRGGIRFKNAPTASDRGLNSKKYLHSEREEDEILKPNLNLDSNIIGASLTKQELIPNFDDDLSSIPPVITSNRRILEIGREKDWDSYNRDSTIIKNVGKWYIGLPPGQSVRAHVQNIDILPIGGRILSPAEALRRDELTSLSHV